MRGINTKSLQALQAVIATAREDVERARATLGEWVATKTAAEAELASLEARSGSEALDDPGAAERLPRVMQELRDRVEIAGRAVAAQRPRVIEAERRYLSAEADLLEAPIAQAKATLAAHEAKTAELLALLVDHEGPFVAEALLIQERWSPSSVMQDSHRDVQLPKSDVMRVEIERAEAPVRVLRDLAAGRDPQVASHDDYPACVWGPDALVPVASYLRRVQEATAHLRGLEELAERLPAEIEAYRQRADLPPEGVAAHVEQRIRALGGLNDEIASARAELARLGVDA